MEKKAGGDIADTFGAGDQGMMFGYACDETEEVPLTLSLPLQLVKQCVGTVSLDTSNDEFDLNCNEVSGPFWFWRI